MKRPKVATDRIRVRRRWPVFAWVECDGCEHLVRREWVWQACDAFLDVVYGCTDCFPARITFAKWAVGEKDWLYGRRPTDVPD